VSILLHAKMDEVNEETVTAESAQEVELKFLDNIVDGVTKKLAVKIGDLTNGAINIDSILSGQIKVDGNRYIDKMLMKMAEKT